MKIVVIVQARMSSARLPGKILKDVAGKPMLAQQLYRLQQCSLVDEIVIATTMNDADDPVVDLARSKGISCYRGSEQDVLSRFVGAATQAKADVVVRSTADCPLIDPHITGQVISELIEHAPECDYASNVQRRTYPRGLDTEAFFIDTLLRIDRLGKSPAAREHVTIVPRAERPDLFLCRDVVDVDDNSDLRWTVDTKEDLQMVRSIYEALNLVNRIVPYREMISYVRVHPELICLNQGIETWSPV